MCTDSEYVGWLNNPFAWWVYHPKTRLLRIGFPYVIHVVQRSKSKKWQQKHGNYEPNQPQSNPYETMQNPSEMAESKLDTPEMFHGFSSKNAQTLRLFLAKTRCFPAPGGRIFRVQVAHGVRHLSHLSESWQRKPVGNPGRIRRKKAAKWWSITDVTIWYRYLSLSQKITFF